MSSAPRSARMTLTKNGVPCAMTFTEVSIDWMSSDCKRYSITVVRSPGVKPFTAWLRPSHKTPDKDGAYPMAEHLGAYEKLEGRDGAIAACIRHKRANPIEITTQSQNATPELSP